MFDHLSRFFIIAGAALSFLVFKTDWSIARIIFNSTPSPLETNTQSLEQQKMMTFSRIEKQRTKLIVVFQSYSPFFLKYYVSKRNLKRKRVKAFHGGSLPSIGGPMRVKCTHNFGLYNKPLFWAHLTKGVSVRSGTEHKVGAEFRDAPAPPFFFFALDVQKGQVGKSDPIAPMRHFVFVPLVFVFYFSSERGGERVTGGGGAPPSHDDDGELRRTSLGPR